MKINCIGAFVIEKLQKLLKYIFEKFQKVQFQCWTKFSRKNKLDSLDLLIKLACVGTTALLAVISNKIFQ